MIRVGLIGALWVLFSVATAAAAITQDSTSHDKSDSTAALTFSHTVVSNTNGILVCGVGTTEATGVTYNGVAMTLITSLTSGRVASLWYLLAPTTGAHNVVVTLSGTGGVVAGCAAYTGVDQTTPYSHLTSSIVSGATSSTLSIASETNNLAIDLVSISQDSTTATPGGSQTTLWAELSPVQGYGGGMSSRAGAGTSALTAMSWTWSGAARNYTEVGISLNAVGNAPSSPATITAATCSNTDVATANAFAQNGDTVVIPAGTCSWTSTLNVTANITLRGGGTQNTTTRGPGASNPTIQDDVYKGAAGCSGGIGPLIAVTATGTWRVSNFTIEGSAADPSICGTGQHITAITQSTTGRIDHIAITNQQVTGILIDGAFGVGDHNTFSASHKAGYAIYHNAYLGVGDNGDNSWAQADSMGTANAWFIEDNTFVDDFSQGAGCLDTFHGGRWVFRYNTCSFVGTHGTESGHRSRSLRQFEIYENTFTSQPGGTDTMVNLRGGTGVMFNNTYSCYANDCGANNLQSIVKLNNDRDGDAFPPWGTGGGAGKCDGTSDYDSNDGVNYVTSTATAGTTTDSLVDSTKNFATACGGGSCIGYSIVDSTAGVSSTITGVSGNTATTVGSGFGSPHTYASGDSYTIKRAYPCVDQIGRGAGDYLSGGTPSPAAWPNQALSPMYVWNETFKGAAASASNLSSASAHVVLNRDYYYATKPGYTSYTYPHPLVGSSTGWQEQLTIQVR